MAQLTREQIEERAWKWLNNKTYDRDALNRFLVKMDAADGETLKDKVLNSLWSRTSYGPEEQWCSTVTIFVHAIWPKMSFCDINHYWIQKWLMETDLGVLAESKECYSCREMIPREKELDAEKLREMLTKCRRELAECRKELAEAQKTNNVLKAVYNHIGQMIPAAKEVHTQWR